MKNWILSALTGLAFLTAGGAASAQTIKLGTLAPKGSPWFENLQDMAADWGAASGGRIKVRIYPGGSIGDERDMVRKMQIGQLQGAVLTAEGLSIIVPEVLALQLPMIFKTDGELDYVRDKLKPELEAMFEKRGYKILNWGDIGWVRLFSRDPVVVMDDLRKQKLFTWAGDPELAEGYKVQGLQVVPLPVPEIFSGLQSGMIDALYAAPVAALSYQWFGLANNMTELKVLKLIGATVVTHKTWNKISPEVRDDVAAAAIEAGDNARDKIRNFEDEAIRVMQEHGLTIHNVTAEQADAWEVSSRQSWKVYTKSLVPPKLVDRVEALRDEYRKQQATAN
ncbi:MAG: TRAP transporter substrate-binding protein DctP [Alphaproteobacteria bacterium]|nr:TRAP transporter substrate-binding protein DctP [Alphaproteobacteria bacterium]